MLCMTLSILAAIVVAAVSMIGSLASALYTYRRNATSVSSDVIVNQDRRIAQLKEDMATLQKEKDDEMATLQKEKDNEVDALKKRVTDLETDGNTKKGEIEYLKALVQGRDPDTQKLSAAAATYMLQSAKMLEALLIHFKIPIPSLPS